MFDLTRYCEAICKGEEEEGFDCIQQAATFGMNVDLFFSTNVGGFKAGVI